MRYLVDANVLSEPTRPSPDANVVAWLAANETSSVIDPIIVGELRAGVLILPAGRKRNLLEAWVDRIAETIECIPWDVTCGFRWARLLADLRKRGEAMPIADSMIATTALVHDLTIATRNVRDFRKAGVPIVNPFD